MNKMTITHLSVITLNVNGLTCPIRSLRMAKWIEKEDPVICCSQETCFSLRYNGLRVKGQRKLFQANGNQKKAGLVIHISGKIDFKLKMVKRGKKGNYIIKRLIHQEDITIVNTYAANIGAPKYVKQTLTELKGEIAIK